MARTALILGISGQDGTYLAQLLLSKGYEVHGTSRDAATQRFGGLSRLEIRDAVQLHSASLHDFRTLLEVVTRVAPDEIYDLAGQSSVGLSFEQPMETFESVSIGVIQVLEVLRYLKAPTRFYNACSSECFGEVDFGARSTETSPFHPRSPYAMAKAAGFWATANYREAFGLYACSGILYNHESPLRPERFVTGKIVAAAVRLARGERLALQLGNLDIWRDWGYAPEYANAMWRMLQQQQPSDYVIATGESHSLQEFLERVFARVGLHWREYVRVNPELLRPSDLYYSGADPSKALRDLGWQATTRFDALVDRLVNAKREETP